jgi:protoporphyrinogen oxidase
VAGGIDAVPQAMHRACAGIGSCSIRLSTEVEEIDLPGRRVKVSTSPRWVPWRSLVSTVPLPDLLDRIPGLPPPVAEARGALRSIPLRYLDVATRAPAPMREHWMYVPDPRYPFYRVGNFTSAVPAMAPPGCSALWVELVDRGGGPVDVRPALDGLARLGAITAVDDVVFAEHHDVPHAYVVFDEARKSAVATIREWLAGHRVHLCGRYGAWSYGSMEDAIVDGIDAARRVSQPA